MKMTHAQARPTASASTERPLCTAAPAGRNPAARRRAASSKRMRILAPLRLARSLGLLLALALAQSLAYAQELDFHPPAAAGDATTPAVMRDLAVRVLPVYQENDAERYLANLSALQLTSGDFAAAYATQQSLRERRQHNYPDRLDARELVSDIYVRARAIEAQDRVSFAQGFTQSFQDLVLRLNNQDADALIRRLRTPLSVLQEDLQKSFDQRRAKGKIDLADAVGLIRTYLTFDAYRSFAPLVDALDADDDHRRYIHADEVPIEIADGRSISVVLVRPRSASKPLPTLLELTLDAAAQNYAKECAAHGYVGVVAYIRGRADTPSKVVPYQHDAADATAVINWIAKQSWSNGQVGMYGGSYGAYTQWAAAKHLPPALKAIATFASSAPGINSPMEGNIFRNSMYRLSYCATNNSTADEKSCNDDAQWRALDEAWYKSGKSYRDFGRLYKKPNRIFHRWLNHPSYDRFWQKLIPYREEFAHVDIPVLATTGYYADGEIGSLYYFTQHSRFNPRANESFLIGPYDDNAMRHAAATFPQGYQADPVAAIDLRELRFQWFDHVLKGGPAPELLKDRVNYEVMGANEWRHAQSIEAMAKGSLRFYLDAADHRESHVLARHETSSATFVRQTIDLADRSDAAWLPSADITSRELKTHNGVTFVSEPLAHPVEFEGLFTALLDFNANKMDMDLNIALYELLPSGEYLKLFDPAYEFRASYVRDRVHRHLLKAGERQQLTVKSERMMSRKLQAGSRVVMVLGVNKRPDREINYGTGADVGEEAIDAGKVPLKIRWYSDSYIEIPVR
jgi:putative CocE/NonD family hydrolase